MKKTAMRKTIGSAYVYGRISPFLGSVLDDFKFGDITKDQAIGAIAHVITAVDVKDYEEASKWLEHYRKLM